MRMCLFVGLLGLALMGMGVLQAEDSKPTEKKFGTLSEKPGEADEGVVAILTPPAGDGKINLIAEGDLAAQLVALAKKGATVLVIGTLEGSEMKVTEVTEGLAVKLGPGGVGVGAGAEDAGKKNGGGEKKGGGKKGK